MTLEVVLGALLSNSNLHITVAMDTHKEVLEYKMRSPVYKNLKVEKLKDSLDGKDYRIWLCKDMNIREFVKTDLYRECSGYAVLRFDPKIENGRVNMYIFCLC